MPAVRGAMPKQLRQLTWTSQCDVAVRVSPSYLVGMPVKVLWPQDAAWYLGTVTGWEGEHSWQHKVEYEDGDSELLLLACEKVQCPADLLACAPPPTATQLFALAQ
ncbi:histone-lysine N-methyltransferase, partial [Haematococcus lacustris]